MIFYVQYNSSLLMIQMNRRKTVGELYGQIIEELSILSRQVIYMVCNGSILGMEPLSFEKNLSSTGLSEKSLIFVILNHYPELTQLYCNSTHDLYQQWNNRQHLQLDDSHIKYDAILERNHNARHQSQPIRRDPPQPSEYDNRNVTSTETRRYIYTRRRSPSEHSSSERSPSERQPPSNNTSSNMRAESRTTAPAPLRMNSSSSRTNSRVNSHPNSRNNASEYAAHVVSSFLTPFLNNAQFNITIDDDDDDDDPDMHTTNMVNFFNLLTRNGGLSNLFDNVPVTLSNEQYNILQKKKYKDVIDLYKTTHQNEQPYNTCPITREQFDDDTDVVILGCGHYFSEDGIKPWLSEQSTKCPCCNADVRESLPPHNESSNTEHTTS